MNRNKDIIEKRLWVIKLLNEQNYFSTYIPTENKETLYDKIIDYVTENNDQYMIGLRMRIIEIASSMKLHPLYPNIIGIATEIEKYVLKE